MRGRVLRSSRSFWGIFLVGGILGGYLADRIGHADNAVLSGDPDHGPVFFSLLATAAASLDIDRRERQHPGVVHGGLDAPFPDSDVVARSRSTDFGVSLLSRSRRGRTDARSAHEIPGYLAVSAHRHWR